MVMFHGKAGGIGGYVYLHQLNQHAREYFDPFYIQLAGYAGIEFMQNCIFELKWQNVGELAELADSSPDEDERKLDIVEREKLVQLMKREDMEASKWMAELFEYNKHKFYKWLRNHATSTEKETMQVMFEAIGFEFESLLDEKWEGEPLVVIASPPVDQNYHDIISHLKTVILASLEAAQQ